MRDDYGDRTFVEDIPSYVKIFCNPEKNPMSGGMEGLKGFSTEDVCAGLNAMPRAT